MGSLQGKIAVVTGANRGIDKGIDKSITIALGEQQTPLFVGRSAPRRDEASAP